MSSTEQEQPRGAGGADRNPEYLTAQQIQKSLAGVRGLLASVSSADVQQLITQLVQHPDLLVEAAFWDAIRLEAPQGSSNYEVMLRGIIDADCPHGIEENSFNLLRRECRVRLGGTLRRTPDQVDEAITLLDPVLEELQDADGLHLRTRGTANYERGMAAVAADDAGSADGFLIQSSADAEKAGHVHGALQGREARAYWVLFKQGKKEEAMSELDDVLRMAWEEAARAPGDSVDRQFLYSTHANAGVHLAEMRDGKDLNEAASVVPELAENPVYQGWVKQ